MERKGVDGAVEGRGCRRSCSCAVRGRANQGERKEEEREGDEEERATGTVSAIASTRMLQKGDAPSA